MSANERILAAEAGFLSTAWSRTRVGSFLSQPVNWVFLAVGGIIGFLSLYPTFFLFYGSVVDAPDCTASLAGTADDVRQDSMAGTYTGSDTCGGTFAGGRFTLLKQ